MAQTHKWLVQWLRDAHAMEEQAETRLSGQLSRLENYPELSDRLRIHLEETKSQAARLRKCLDLINESTSAMKDAGGKLTAMAQSISGVFAGDEVMKGSLAGYTFEHMEIASYTILIAAAEDAGEAEVARICEEKSSGGNRNGGMAQEQSSTDNTKVFESSRSRQRQREKLRGGSCHGNAGHLDARKTERRLRSSFARALMIYSRRATRCQ